MSCCCMGQCLRTHPCAVGVQMNALSRARSDPRKWIIYRSQDTLGVLVPVRLKKKTHTHTRASRRNATNAHNNLHLGDSDSLVRYFAIARWNVWDGLMLRGRHNYFSLIFYPDFIEESAATPPRKTCQIHVPLMPGYVFTRCLGGGSRGSGGKR